MTLGTADVLLHPVRLRIALALLGGRALTTGELGTELSDVPPATLYRHVAALADGGVLDVVEERRARGAVERTYALAAGAGHVDAEAARAMSPDDHRRAFLTFVLSLVASFDTYLATPAPDLARDVVGYRQAALRLTDEEAYELVAELREVVGRRLDLPPAPGRRRRVLATVLMPTEASGPPA